MKITKICCIGARICWRSHYGNHRSKCPHIEVTVVDLNEERIAAWNDKDVNNIPIYEPGLAAVVASEIKFIFSTNVEKAIDERSSYFISVNTPTIRKGYGSRFKVYRVVCETNIAKVAKDG
jgi:UDPglucose 6-dehydrogenase